MKKNRLWISGSAAIFIFLMSYCARPKQHGLVYYNDFESEKGWSSFNLAKGPAHSGAFSNKFDSLSVYGSALRLKFSEIDADTIRKVKCRMWCLVKNPETAGAKIVIEINDAGKKNIFWDNVLISDFVKNAGEWVELKAEWKLPVHKTYHPGNEIAVYPWNVAKEEFYIDDFRVEFVK